MLNIINKSKGTLTTFIVKQIRLKHPNCLCSEKLFHWECQVWKSCTTVSDHRRPCPTRETPASNLSTSRFTMTDHSSVTDKDVCLKSLRTPGRTNMLDTGQRGFHFRVKTQMHALSRILTDVRTRMETTAKSLNHKRDKIQY